MAFSVVLHFGRTENYHYLRIRSVVPTVLQMTSMKWGTPWGCHIFQVSKAGRRLFWDPAGKAYLLDSLLDNLGGWNLQSALAINNRNQIVGKAFDASGTQRGYVLNPLVPEQSAEVTTIIAFLLTSLFFRLLVRNDRRTSW